MKKKILIIFTGAMELGGVEKSLLGLLDALDYNRYDVDLFLYAHHGALFQFVNPNVNLIPEVNELAYLRESMKEKLKHGAFYSAYRRIVDSFGGFSSDKSWKKVMLKYVKPMKTEYDLALSFFLPFDLLKERVNAKVKIGWVHTDYSAEDKDGNRLRTAYQGVDKIVAVSDACGEAFAKVVPEYRDKLITIENILPEKLINKQANELAVSTEMPKDGSINLLSVGRFCYAKNFDNIPEICSLLLKSGLQIKWYIIGFGGDEALIREKITAFNMENHVIILGKKDNPYPYIKACDVYVQPSRYEGKCVAVREAQMLRKPVVITNYTTSSSQLEDGVDGVIVPMDNRGCAEGIIALLSNKEKMLSLSRMCKERDYTNASEVVKLYEILEG